MKKMLAKNLLVFSLFGIFIFSNSIFAQTKSKNNSYNFSQFNIEKKDLMQTVSDNSADVELNLDLTKYSDDINFWSDIPNAELAYVLTKKMTDEELLSQIFMFGWAGAEPSALLNSWVQDRGLGSVKVFGWNTDNTTLVAKSISALQKKAQSRRFKIPLFVATDQEGGWIRHVKGNTSITPGNLSIGSSGLPIDSWYSSYYISKEIAALGINLNFAPTVDLYTNQDSTIIGTRSFGEDPTKAAILGVAFAAGSMQAGIIPTAKHFPGHGDTEYDSHVFLPEIDADIDTIHKRELVPFKYLINAKIPAIMSGHLSFPKIRENGEPASLSKYFLTDLLRGELGYKGLIITDDMMMNGDTLYAGSLSNAFKMAIEAGNDIILSSTTAQLNESLWTTNLARMKSSPEFKSKVQKAARRVIEVKLNYFKKTNPVALYPNETKIDQAIPDRQGQDFFVEQACRSIAIYKKGELPYKPENLEAQKKVLLVGSEPSFFEQMNIYYKNCENIKLNYFLGPNETQNIINQLSYKTKDASLVILCVWDKNSAKIAHAVKQYKTDKTKIIIFSLMAPNFSYALNWADTVLFGYSYSPYSLVGLAAVCAGRFEATGTLPIEVK